MKSILHKTSMAAMVVGVLLTLPVTARAGLDFVFANFSPTFNRVCLGDDMGGFACSDVDAGNIGSIGVALGDVDGDTILDAVFARIGPSNRVCLGDGMGGFVCSNVSADTNRSIDVALGDLDGDGNLDAVFVNQETNRVCLGDGMGGFACSNVSAVSDIGQGVALGFVDGDDNLDAVFANFSQLNFEAPNRVCLGNGTGGFACSDVNVGADFEQSIGVALGDVDGDGFIDAVFANTGQKNRVCLGDGTGGFACSDVSADTFGSFDVALGDMDGDTNLDAVFSNRFQTNRVCLGDGMGGFTCSNVSADTRASGDVVLADMDGDGNLDAVFANRFQTNRVCLGDGMGGFTSCSDVSADMLRSRGVALGELDGVALLIADAGADQTQDEGSLVTLDGSASANAANYEWAQVAGPTVTLSSTTAANPDFTAPFVGANTTLTFQLVVGDGADNFSDPDSVDIAVVNANNPPVADAGDDSTIKPGAVATLDGSRSFDPENDPITYQWTQVSGTPVTLSDDSAQKPTFPAPNMVGDVLVFQLQLTDGMEASTPSAGTDSSLADTVAVTIVPNSQPVANAGPGQTKDEGSLVTLNGAASFDSDGGDILSFQWTQTGGTLVTLSNSTVAGPTFTAPFVGAGGDDLAFSLVVTDDDPVNPLDSLPNDVIVHVSNINDPPSCNLAVANPGTLWPPTHKMKSVNIDGVMDSDAEFNTVILQISAVTQDEPVNGLGDGDSSPDAVIQIGDPTDRVLIRAERSGNENGRVYSIGFSASDGFESCSGAVEVTVPHSRKSGSVDDGQVFDSTQP